MHVSVSLDYLTLFQHGKQITGVADLAAFYHHTTTAYMCMRKDIIQRTATVVVFSGAISPTLIGTTLFIYVFMFLCIL